MNETKSRRKILVNYCFFMTVQVPRLKNRQRTLEFSKYIKNEQMTRPKSESRDSLVTIQSRTR